MGNGIASLYSVDTTKAIDGGDYIKWKLVSATETAHNKNAATLFVFEKSIFDTYRVNPTLREEILYFLRKDAAVLLRLRHPNIISIQEPLSEDRSTLAFATKAVEGTLLHHLQNRKSGLTPLEAKCGILEVLEALMFLHNDAKMAHLAINTETIFVAPDGKWLLGGMGSSMSLTASGLQPCPFAYPNTSYVSTNCCTSVAPPLSYAPPEYSTAALHLCGAASDIFSLGLIIYQLFSNKSNQKLLQCNGYDVHQHQRMCQSVSTLVKAVPEGLAPLLQQMLSVKPEDRPTADKLIDNAFFQNVNVRALRFLDRFHEKDESQKIIFLEHFKSLLSKNSELLEPSILKYRVLPALLQCLLFSSLYPTALPNIFFALHHVKDTKWFVSSVWPSMMPLLSSARIQIECVILLLSELQLLLELSNEDIHKSHLLPFVTRCLRIKENSVQDEALKSVVFTSHKADYVYLKNSVLPHVTRLITTTDSHKLRISGVNALISISDAFDRTIIVESIIAAIEKVTDVDKSPDMCMCVCSAFERLSKLLGPKLSAQHVLPPLCPLLVAESLDASQYERLSTIFESILIEVKQFRRQLIQTADYRKAAVNRALGHEEKDESLDAIFESRLSRSTSEESTDKLNDRIWRDLNVNIKQQRNQIPSTTNRTTAASNVPFYSQPMDTAALIDTAFSNTSVTSNSFHKQRYQPTPDLSSLTFLQPMMELQKTQNTNEIHEKDPFEGLDPF